jgi:excinuclease UvrABC nuclease subunit
LEAAMTTAAAAWRYEEAAVLRDQWEALGNLHEQLHRFREAQRHYSFIYPVHGGNGGCLWYFVHSGQVCQVVEQPLGFEAAEQCLAAIERIYRSRRATVDQAMREDAEVTLLVASWFRSRPEELQRTFSIQAAMERLRPCRFAAVGA